MLVGTKRLCKVIIVGQCAADDNLAVGIIGGRVEVVMIHGLALPVHRCPLAVGKRLPHLRPVDMVSGLLPLRQLVVEEHVATCVGYGHA